MSRNYVDNAMNRRLGRVGMPVGSAVHSRSGGSSLSSRCYVDNSMNQALGRVGKPVGSAVHSRGASNLASSPASSSSSASSSPRTYVDNSMNRTLGRVGQPVGSAVHSRGASSSPSSATTTSNQCEPSSPSSSVKTYVDNRLNRKLGRVGLPVGSAVHRKGDPIQASSSESPSSSVKTYADNPLNRKLGRVGLPVGSAVYSKGDPNPSSSPDSSSLKVYKDNALNRRLDRVGEPLGTAVYSKKNNPSGSPIQLESRVYMDNAFNRKHNRVGLPLGSKPVSKGDLVYQDNPLNRSLDRVGLPLGSQNSTKKLQTLRKLLGPEEIQSDSGFVDPSVLSFYDDNEEQMEDDFNHVQEFWNRSKQVDEWIESNKEIRSTTEHEDSLCALQGNHINFEDLVLKSKIGHGGFGDVYFAEYNSQIVAVKILRQSNLSKKRLEMFKEEIIKHSRLDHPNIVKFFGPSLGRDVVAFVMEYMDASLWESIHVNELDFWPEHKLKILKDITSGLAYLHSLPLTHGDLKTQNVLLINVPGLPNYNDHEQVKAKLSDFGLSLLKSDMETSSTKKYLPAGMTLRFAAPEVIQGRRLNASELCKADIYSMGLLIMELAVEEIPFENLTIPQLIHEVGSLGTKPAVPSGLTLDEKLENLLELCLSFSPDERPSAKDLCRMASSVTAIYSKEE